MKKSYAFSTSEIGLIACALALCLHVPAFSQSLLWKISGNGLAKCTYVYGTIHIKDKRVFAWKDLIYSKIDECDHFVAEIDLNPENLMHAASLLMLPEGKTLRDIFTADEYELIRNKVRDCSGYELSLFDRIKPAALIALCLPGNPKNDLEATVDEMLYRYAVSKGKEVTGIETIAEQAAMMDIIPNNYVYAYFKEYDKQAGEIEKLISLYQSARLDSLLVLLEEGETGALLIDDLLIFRNQRMVERLLPVINEHSAFIAIGAGHLPGQQGVLQLLRSNGYFVEPVPFTFQDE
jgi:uncharacterized protein YbaP (TraB family)